MSCFMTALRDDMRLIYLWYQNRGALISWLVRRLSLSSQENNITFSLLT